MSSLWLVARYEYKRHVLKPSFIVAILSMPLVIGLSIGLGWLTDTLKNDTSALGYVDHAGLLMDPLPAPKRGSTPDNPGVPGLVPLIAFPTEQAARKALESGEIQAYYVLAADYFETNHVDLVYLEPPDGVTTRQFWDFMQINRLTDLPKEVACRAVAGSNLIVRWPDDAPGGRREFSPRTFFNNFLPLIVGAAFMFLLFMSSGYLMGTMMEEKGSRTVEILMTSISSNQLIGGKVVGIVAVSFTQFLAWVALAGLIVLIGGHLLGIEPLLNVALDLRIIAPMIAVFVPAYVMIAALMTAIGATFAEAQEAQQMMSLFILPSMVPIWLIQPIVENPNGPIAIGLSLFPITALPTISLRMMFSYVPLAQILASVAILVLCAGGAVWLAGRAFRRGMLRYGQNLNWRDLFFGRG
jgi:ABC-2 type transport system permease protein